MISIPNLAASSVSQFASLSSPVSFWIFWLLYSFLLITFSGLKKAICFMLEYESIKTWWYDLYECISSKLPDDQALTALDLEFNTALCKKDITFLGFFLVGIPERVLYIQVLKHLSVHQVFDQMSERNQYRDIFCFFWIYWQSIETIELLGKLRCISTLCV